MARPSTRRSDILPLFVAEELAAIARVEQARAELAARIGALAPHSHRRIALEARLASLTVEALRLETALEGRR